MLLCRYEVRDAVFPKHLFPFTNTALFLEMISSTRKHRQESEQSNNHAGPVCGAVMLLGPLNGEEDVEQKLHTVTTEGKRKGKKSINFCEVTTKKNVSFVPHRYRLGVV